MKNFTKSFVHKMLLCLLFQFFLWMPAFGQGFTAETEARLQEVLNKFQNDPEHPFVGGMSASIKIDGMDKWAGASGYAARNVNEQNELLPGGIPFTTTTSSRIYSITKTFTSALILQLAEEGKLSLDDPLSKYFPIAAINASLSGNATIRQLLNHRSGFSDYVTEPLFQFAVAYEPSRIWSPYEIVYFARKIAEPGAESRYSSTNYIILGAIAEAVTGRAYASLLRDRFFTPLNLRSSYLAVFEAAAGNGQTLGASPHDNLSPFNPLFAMLGRPTFPDAYTNVSQFDFTGIASSAFSGGGIVSTADDIVEWGSMLFNGSATGKKVLKQMMESLPENPEDDGDYLGYGIMSNYKISDTERFVGHNGRAPGYRAVMFHQPDKNVTISILTNFANADAYAIARELYAVISELYAGDKIKLCFKGKTLQVSQQAAPALLAKGAVLGACEGSANRAGAKETAAAAPHGLQLNTYPNPSDSHFNFSFSVPEQGAVSLEIINVRGEVIASLYKGEAKAGEQKAIAWTPAQSLAAGLYISRLTTAQGVKNQKIIINR